MCILFTSNILFAQTTSWKGITSTSWATATNWTTGVPNSTTDAIIGDANFTGANQPTISGTSSCKSLTVGSSSSATLTVNKALTVWGDLSIGSTGTLTQKGITITVKGNWSNGGTYSYTSTISKITFAGTAETISGPNSSAFRKITVNTGSTVTLNINISVAGNFTLAGTFIPSENVTPYVMSGGGTTTLSSGCLLKVNASTYAGNYALTGSITVNTGTTVEYSATLSNQTIKENLAYSTLKISGSGVKTLTGNLTNLKSSATTEGNIYVNSGTLDISTFTANRGTTTVGGTFSVSNEATLKISGTNTFPSNYNTKNFGLTSIVEYSGTAQTVSAQTYGNLILSSSSGAATKTMPATDFTVFGNFSSTIGFGTSLTFTAASNITISGNVNIGASTTFNGGSFTHNITGNWINNGTFTGSTSTINLNGAGSSISGTGVHNFNNLTIAASGITAAAASNISIAGNLSAAGSGSFTHASGGTLTMTGAAKTITGTAFTFDNLTISGSITAGINFTLTGNLSVSGSLTATGGTIIMSGSAKTISGAGTVSFGSISVSGSITTTSSFFVATSLDVSGSLTASAGTATFTGTSTLNGTANLYNVTLNGTSLQLSTNAVLGIANTYTVTSGTLNVSSTTPNTVNYNGTGAQTITSGTYHHLILSNGNTKTAGGAITANGDITIAASTTFSASSFTHTVKGDWTTTGTFTASASIISFTGSADANIIGATTFNTLTINKSSSSNQVNILNNVSAATVNMTTGILSTSSNTLTITTTRTGNGIILGNIQRTHTFSIGVAYAFEGPDNTITFTTVLGVSSVTVNVTKGAISDFPFGNSVNRVYNITIPSGTYIATLRLHYEDAELNGSNESTMQTWHYSGSAWSATGKSANSSAANYVEQTLLTSITGRWTLSDVSNVVQWNGSVSNDWFNASNWTTVQGNPSKPPGINDIVQIGTATFTNQPTINSSASVKSILFGSAQGVTLSVTTGGSLTAQGNISGAWSANAIHTINANNQNITVNGDLILSDGTSNHVINVSAGIGTITLAGSLTETGGANVTFTGSGSLNIGNNFNYTSGAFTASTSSVTYNGTVSQTIAGLTYNNLTINKTAGIASINNAATISGNLSVSAGELDINAATTISGNVTISAGAILNGDGVTVLAGGNWTNSGTFISLAGTINFNGTGTQNISSTTFNNLTINKTSGTATPTGNLTINGNLSVSAGTLDLSTFNGNRSSAGGILSVSNGATLLAGGANNFPSNFNTNSFGSNSTVNYNGAAAQSIAGVTYGNLTLTNGGANAKTLAASATISGNFLINSGATFNAGAFTINLSGNYTNSGTFTAATSTMIFNGSSKTITGNTTFNKLTVNGSYTVSGSDLTFNGLLLITSGASFDAGTGTATLNGDLTNNGSLTSSGTTTFTGTSLQTIRITNTVTSNAGSILNFNGSVAPSLNFSSAPVFATLNINNTAGITPNTDWTIATAFNISNGASFFAGSYTHNINGAFTNNGTVTSSGILNFSPSSIKNYTLAGTNFTSTGSIIFGGSGAITTAGTPNSLNDITISNTTGVSPGTGWNIGGNFTINNSGIFNAGSYGYTVAGNLQSTGTLNGSTSTFTMSSAAAQLAGNITTTFYNLTVTGAVTVNADFNISGNLTTTGTLDASAATVIFTGSSNATISGAATDLASFNIAKNSGGIVTLARNVTLVTDIDIVSGTLDASTFSITQDGTAGLTNTLAVGANAAFKIAGTNSLPTFTAYNFDSLSTVEYSGTTQTITSISSLAAKYGNVTISSSGTKTANGPLNIRNNFALTNGTFFGGNNTDTLGGNWNMSSGTFTNTGTTILLNGTGTQDISSSGAFNNLISNKSAGITTLSANATVNGALTFTSGKIQTGSFSVIMPSGASVSGAGASTGWVNGKLQKNITTGTNVLRTFEVGDNSNYAPATVSFASVSAAGNLTANVTNTDHPNLASSVINANRSVNRYWTFTNSATIFTSSSITMNWVAADVDAGSVTANFKVSEYAANVWTLPAVISPLSTSIQTTGITSFGDFAVGETGCAVIASASNNGPVCSGSTINLTGSGSGGSGNYNYSWSGPNSFTSTVQNPSVSNATTAASGIYALMVTDASNGCSANTTTAVTVNATPSAPTISAESATTFCQGGSVVLTSSASSNNVWSTSATTQSITVSTSGSYTVHYTDANGCTSLNSAATVVTVNATP
ncbi:MAG: hypothetical protein ABJA79_00110, partial [Parafilimonas sp.]